MFRMKCVGQNYPWGKQAASSLVASIIKKNNEPCDDSKRYAEYWMGSHVNGPSSIYDSNGSLKPINDCIKPGKGTLDFLFKVLSIDLPLSIQLHPNKETSNKLHQQFPSVYKDPNHKPEMFIAISEDFELLFGFKPINQAVELLKTYSSIFDFKEAKDLVSNPTEDNYKNFIFAIINLNLEVFKKIIDQLLETSKDEFLSKLFKESGHDIGIIVSMFMNHLKCKKNDSMFILPNIPHAYIKGECFEIMANSDNVIRLGLTPKLVDKDNFKLILNDKFKEMVIDHSTVSQTLVITKENNIKTTYQNPLFEEFRLEHIKLDEQTNKEIDLTIQEETVLFVFKGDLDVELTNDHSKDAKTIKELECYFIQYSSKLKLKTKGQNAEVYVASSNKKN